MKTEDVCQKYFSGFEILGDYDKHSKKENALAALSIASYLTVIVPLAFGITYLISKIWTHINKDELPATEEKTAQIANTALGTANSKIPPALRNENMSVRLDRVGGFSQSGNTCFIAVGLQALRQIPSIRKMLSTDQPLLQNDNESTANFELRKKIKDEIYNLFKDSDNGHTIDVHRFRKFHELIYAYEMQVYGKPFLISVPGKGGDQTSFTQFITKLVNLEYANPGYRHWDGFNKDTYVDLLIQECVNSIPNLKIVVITRLNPYDTEKIRKNPEFQMERLPEGIALSKETPMEVECDGRNKEIIKYTLVAATGGTSNHTVAYLKDKDHPDGWVYCNDGHVKKVKEIHEHYTVQYLYYARMD